MLYVSHPYRFFTDGWVGRMRISLSFCLSCVCCFSLHFFVYRSINFYVYIYIYIYIYYHFRCNKSLRTCEWGGRVSFSVSFSLSLSFSFSCSFLLYIYIYIYIISLLTNLYRSVSGADAFLYLYHFLSDKSLRKGEWDGRASFFVFLYIYIYIYTCISLP